MIELVFHWSTRGSNETNTKLPFAVPNMPVKINQIFSFPGAMNFPPDLRVQRLLQPPK
jgi:hypothetical protein